MIKDISQQIDKKKFWEFIGKKTDVQKGDLKSVVRKILNDRNVLLNTINKYDTPFFLLDQQELSKSIDEFRSAFYKYIPSSEIFYAMKSNDCEYVIKEVVKQGLGVDVSGERELKIALQMGAKNIVFSGPGKTDKELEIALENSDKLILHIDSFSELRRLGELSDRKKQKVRCGIRVFTKFHGKWTKFGISIDRIGEFWKEAEKYKFIDLQGIQCHISWNTSAKPYENIIKEIFNSIKIDNVENKIKFIDLGGGFYPDSLEGYFPWATPQGKIISTYKYAIGSETNFADKYYIEKSITIEKFAQGIKDSLSKHINPKLENVKILFEPGRIISTKSMHIVFKIIDIKKNFAIADAGTNMTGWEKKLNTYYPLINLTNPSDQEIPYQIFGSLCTPDDIWGYYFYGSKIEEGDIILAPYRGAYTYSFRQEFIKGIPEVFVME